MRVTNPTWYEWKCAIEDAISSSISRAGIPSVSPVTGNRDTLSASVKSESAALKMPYVKVWLTGWSPTDTQARNLKRNYTNKSSASIEHSEETVEDITFNAVVYANIQRQLLDITQAIVSYFGSTGTIAVIKKDTTYESPFEILDYTLDVREDGNGNIQFYSTELSIVLQIKSNRLRDDQAKPIISSVVIESNTTIPGSDEEDDDTITLSAGD